MSFTIATPVLLLLASAGSITVDDVAPDARIYLYGHLLSPPYRFTGVGGDTLMLNDLPFFPTRRPQDEHRPARSRVDYRTSEIMAIAHKAMVGMSPREGLEAAAAIVRAERDVTSVSVDHDVRALHVKFEWHPREVTGLFSLDTREEKPPGGREETHAHQIGAIRAAVAGGATVGKGLGYFLFLSRAAAAEIEAEVDRITSTGEGTQTPTSLGRQEARMVADIVAANAPGQQGDESTCDD